VLCARPSGRDPCEPEWLCGVQSCRDREMRGLRRRLSLSSRGQVSESTLGAGKGLSGKGNRARVEAVHQKQCKLAMLTHHPVPRGWEKLTSTSSTLQASANRYAAAHALRMSLISLHIYDNNSFLYVLIRSGDSGHTSVSQSVSQSSNR
jgi:hypothetical protein